jgi:hypothetical protein
MYGSTMPSDGSPRNGFRKVSAVESDEQHVPLSSGTPSKKWLPLLGVGVVVAIVAATTVMIISSSSSNAKESSSSSVEYCASNKDFSKQTLKPVVDRPVFSLLKPEHLKG